MPTPSTRRDRTPPASRYGLLTALTAVIIVYGSLYPFDFHVPASGAGPVAALLSSWAERPGRGDFVANILLYMPLGWFGILSLPRRISVGLRLGVVLCGGVALSVAMELTQYFDVGRVTAADDVYANLLGTIVGSLAALALSGRWRLPLADSLARDPIATALIAAWAGYRLYPYVPTIDLHKYWTALKPVILDPTLSLGDFYRHTVIWLTIFVLMTALVGRRRSLLLAILLCGCLLAACVAIEDITLSVAEIAGAAGAVLLWPIMLALQHRQRAAALFGLLMIAVIAERLEPFQFQAATRAFGWIPFRSLMAGSIGVDIIAFFEKAFLYGSLLYLFTEAGGRLRSAALIVASVLFATSWAEIYLPDRSAEITDAVMALLLASGFALTREIGDKGTRS